MIRFHEITDNPFSEASGLLFIGDPHLSSRCPGRRMDKDFKQTVLDKLKQSFEIARENHYQPVILGDLFDRASESSLSLFTRFFHILRTHHEQNGLIPVTLSGNHDLKDDTLSEDTALSVFDASGFLHVLKDGVPFYIIEPSHENVIKSLPEKDFLSHAYSVILPYSYGMEHKENGLMDKDFSFSSPKNIFTIALTHGDFDFAGAYPGAAMTKEIKGVDMVVNGHMHKLQPSIRHGKTLWVNTGNITRMSMDCENHMPRVWSWSKGQDILTGIPLRYVEKVFNRTGTHAKPDDAALRQNLEGIDGDDTVFWEDDGTSRFVDMLKKQKEQESPLTEDGSGLNSELAAVYEEQNADELTVGIIKEMVEEVFSTSENQPS